MDYEKLVGCELWKEYNVRRKALIEKPEGYVEPVRKPRPDNNGGHKKPFNGQKPRGERSDRGERKPQNDQPKAE